MKNIEDITSELEAILDSSKLDRVVYALGEICWAKAEHLRSNWQDEELARRWEVAGNGLTNFSIKYQIARVP